MELPLFGRFDLMIVGLIISLSLFLLCFATLFKVIDDVTKLISLAHFRLFILPKQLRKKERINELLKIKELVKKHG